MRDQLSRLLTPLSPELFFDRYWGKHYVHISRPSADRYHDILRIEDIDLLLQSEQLPAAFVNVTSGGTLHGMEEWARIAPAARGEVLVAIPERLFELYRKGATLVLNQAHHSLPGISLACRSLANELRIHVGANVYITPPDGQGFARHSDDHELFILQIAGGKRFILDQNAGGATAVDLVPGDLLYIPRGVRHEGYSQCEPSVHVSMGLNPVYVFQLIEEIASVARNLPEFQQIVPQCCVGENEGQVFQDEFLRRLQGLLATTSVDALAKRRFRALADHQTGGWPGRFSDMLQAHCIAPTTVLKARTEIVISREDDGVQVRLHFAGQSLAVPKFLEGSLNRVLSDSPFMIRDIPGMLSDHGKVDFVKPFVDAGLLAIVKI